MRNFNVLKLFSVLAMIICTTPVSLGGAFESEWTIFDAGFYPPVQLFDKNTNVYGIQLSPFMTKNRNVYGISTGIAGEAENRCGLQAGLINGGRCDGLQAGIINYGGLFQTGLYNSNGGPLQAGLINGGGSGLQAGLINGGPGLLIGLWNMKGGILIGMFNDSSFGFQMGAVNRNGEFQFGLVNLNHDTHSSPCFQFGLLNFYDKGFLPVFPLINF